MIWVGTVKPIGIASTRLVIQTAFTGGFPRTEIGSVERVAARWSHTVGDAMVLPRLFVVANGVGEKLSGHVSYLSEVPSGEDEVVFLNQLVRQFRRVVLDPGCDSGWSFIGVKQHLGVRQNLTAVLFDLRRG